MDVALDVAGDTIESGMSTTIDTNGNDNTVEEHDNIEDNINEAASEDSGMSSVDNHNLSGELGNIPLFCLDEMQSAGRNASNRMQQLSLISYKNRYLTQMHTHNTIFLAFSALLLFCSTDMFITTQR